MRPPGHCLQLDPVTTVQVPATGAEEAGQVGVAKGTRRGEATILRKLTTDDMFEMLVLKLILITYSGHPESRINILFSI